MTPNTESGAGRLFRYDIQINTYILKKKTKHFFQHLNKTLSNTAIFYRHVSSQNRVCTLGLW